jgi:hypothetical protein
VRRPASLVGVPSFARARSAPAAWISRRPAASVVVGFGAAVMVGTVLLLLPVAIEDGSSAPVIELVVVVPLAVRFALFYDESAGRAAYLGVFHAVSSFNNAGFALFTDNMIPFATDPWICLPIVLAVVLGGIGFPVASRRS